MKIVLYTNDCPKCKILKDKIIACELEYSICNDVDEMLKKGFRSVPVLEVNGTTMNYLESINWLKEIC